MPNLPGDDATIAPSALTTAAAPLARTPSTSRLAPGSIIAGRYRLVALLGRGGMGEVYRAEDLTLDQPVALKFLSAGVAADEDHLAQFHNELRVARQVSHKNVCRLYDLGDADGRRFLTMEYVDGEDLASLLRRIGRFPEDRAIDVARQLCAGVSAAHERGVLHRDLKPANVMLDGEGNVRITDFGIATASTDADTRIAGTPQYMAPELLSGKPASTRSDIYALGLVLFEIFTGRRAYDAKTLGDLKQLLDTGTVTTPSAIVRDLDPAVERIILRCLDKDPARRPASALAVAAALPGGHPLLDALAAGETPSPELLAAAGETDALDPRRALTLVAWIVLGLGAYATVSGRTSIVGRMPLETPTAVLVDRAEHIARSLGYVDRVGDRAYGFFRNDEYLNWIARNDRSPQRWNAIAQDNPSALHLWYRTSPREMAPLFTAAVSQSDPALTDSNMRTVVVDTRGRLREFRAVPPQFDAGDTPVQPTRWEALFDAAELSMDAFSPVVPQWQPRDYADARAAWERPLDGRPDLKIRIEAAAFRGRPVWFNVIGPWTQPLRMAPLQSSNVDRIAQAIFVLVFGLLVLGATFFANQNLRLKRADRLGAVRLALFVLTATFFYWAFGGHHFATVGLEFNNVVRSAGSMALTSMFVWLVYVALEPYVRRFWPDGLLGWSRLLSGRVRDARVGRDVLAGVAFGVALVFAELGKAQVVAWLGYEAPFPAYGLSVDTLAGPGPLGALWMQSSLFGLNYGLVFVLLFVVLRLLLRRTWAVVAVGWLALALIETNRVGGNGSEVMILFPIAAGALLTLITLRAGLLTLVVALFVQRAAGGIPLTLDVSQWWASSSNWTLAMLATLTALAFYAARAGQPLLGDLLPRE